MFYLIIAVVLGLFLYFYSKQPSLVARNELRHSALTKIEEIKDGEVVKVVGKVVYSGSTLKAPISGRTCSYYFVEILKWGYDTADIADSAFDIFLDTDSSSSGGSWQILLKKEAACNLLIKSGNTYILIETKNINSSVVIDHYQTDKQLSMWKILSGKKNPIQMQEFLKKNGLSNIDYQSLGYKEGIFEEGETISAIGQARWKDVKDTKLNIPASKVLIIGANAKEPVLVSDHVDTVRF